MQHSSIPQLTCLVLLFFVSVCSSSQTITSQKGLTTAVFNLHAGTIKFRLPKDIRSGDIISGSIVAEPVGKNARQIENNLVELKKYSIGFNGEKFPVDNPGKTFKFLQDPSRSITGPIELINVSGIKTVEINVPTPEQKDQTFSASQCMIPTHALAGSPLQITGSFDGDASNTKCSLDNKPIEVLAESPRQCIVLYPADAKGIQTLTVEENNRQQCHQNVSGVQMQVSAGKLSLLKGEKTYIDVSISGLQNLPDTAVLTLDNITVNVVVMQPMNHVVIPLAPDSVGSGIFNKRFNIQSIKSGDFTVNVNLDLPGAVSSYASVNNGVEKPPVYADNKGGIELHPLKVDGLKNGMSDAFKKAVIEVTGNSASKYPELDGCGDCLKCIQSMLDEGKVALVGEIGKILLEHYVDLLVGKAGGALAWIKDKFDKAEKAEDIAGAIANAVAKNELQVVQFDEKLCGYCLVSAIGFYDTKTGCMDAFFYCKGSKMCCSHALTIIHVKYCVNDDGFMKPGTGMTIDVISQ